jgi:hypothetical protein
MEKIQVECFMMKKKLKKSRWKKEFIRGNENAKMSEDARNSIWTFYHGKAFEERSSRKNEICHNIS